MELHPSCVDTEPHAWHLDPSMSATLTLWIRTNTPRFPSISLPLPSLTYSHTHARTHTHTLPHTPSQTCTKTHSNTCSTHTHTHQHPPAMLESLVHDHPFTSRFFPLLVLPPLLLPHSLPLPLRVTPLSVLLPPQLLFVSRPGRC